MRIQFIHSDIEKFICGLEKNTVAKVLRTFDLLELFGSDLGMPHSGALGDGLFELRIRGRQEVRFLYTFHGFEVIVLHGFIKKSPRIPQRHMKIAAERRRTLDR